MSTKQYFEFIYSPRTTISNIKEKEEKLFADLKIGFDPYTIKIMKKHYKEHLGKLNKETFVSILKRHLLTWYPNLPNRSKILIKLLSRLFDEIDLNSNGDLEWEEFVNYIINSSYQQNYEFSAYGLQHYSLSKEEFFDHQEELDDSMYNNLSNKTENIISHCFYIKKFKMIGIVHEGKSKILFFSAQNNKRKNAMIDLVQTQNEINKVELNELNKKALIKIEKERQERIEAYNYFNNENLNQFKLENINEIHHFHERKSIINIENINNNQNNPFQNTTQKLGVYKINEDEYRIDVSKNKYNKGLFALTTCFVEEYNVLFISASNNKISAWKYDYKTEDFKNINFINYKKKSDFNFEQDKSLTIPLFIATAPQNTLIYDYSLKCLYSGQENGKINKWEMNSPYPTYVFDIYAPKNKIIIEDLSKNNTEENKGEEFLTLGKVKLLYSGYEKDNLGEMGKEKEELFKLEHNTKSISNFKHKRDNISYLLLIENLRLLCSSFLNGLIILWDPDTKKPIKVFTNQKTGVYNMVYDPKKNQIFTCGFEHEIYIYEPYNNENATYKLKGHNSSVNSLAINPELSELISIDVSGIIKIWDTNTYINFQTINTNDVFLLVQNRIKNINEKGTFFAPKKKLASNNYILCYNDPKKLLIYGSKLLIFEKGKEKNPNLTDDNQLLCCVYNKLSKNLISVSNKRIKIWNIFTGKIKKSYDDIMKGNEITAFTCDSQMKRFYLGDNMGHIKCFNLSTGDFIKEFISHENEIVNVIHSTKYELLITCSSDLCIKFQDDKELLTTSLIKETYARPGNYYQLNYRVKLKIAVLDESNSILMMGLTNGTILHYDVAHFKFFLNPNEDQDSKTRGQYPISSLCNIDDIDFLFVACDNGDKFFTAKAKNRLYHYLADEKFGNFIDNNINDINNLENTNQKNIDKNIVLTSSFISKTYTLITGCLSGFLCCYDLKPLYDFMIINETKSEEEIKLNFKKGLDIYMKYKVLIHNEAIKYLFIPEELEPKIIITTSNDKTVKLVDLKTGKYIDTLKQISIKYNPIPIGIKYLKDNPFQKKGDKINDKALNQGEEKEKEENKENKEDKNSIIIYKKDIILPLKKPKINYDEANSNDIVKYFDKMTEFNAKVLLINLSKGQNIPDDKSNLWNYNVDIKKLLKKNEEEIKELIDIVNRKENEINEAEKQHQEISMFNDKYNPVFIENLDNNEKYELKSQINMKIRNINLAISKSEMLKKESEIIQNFLNKSKFNKSIQKEENNKNKILKPIKKKEKLNINKINCNNNDKNKNNKSSKLEDKSTAYTTKNILSNNLLNKLQFKINYPESTENKKIKNFKIFKLNKPNYLHKSSSQSDMKIRRNNNKIFFNDKRFKDCRNEFDVKFKELTSPFETLFKKNRRFNFLPKITKINELFPK